MASMNDITRGSTLRLHDQLWEVTEHLHARTGQRKPTVWTKLKNLRTGKVIENQFRSTDKVDFVRIESKHMEYLYRDGKNYVFMDQETYEQPAIPSEMVAGLLAFLKEGTVCDFRYDEETIVEIRLPEVLEVEVTEALPHVRGDTATHDYRPVTIETGTKIQVPPFIQKGEKIKIDTRSGEYLGRAGPS